MHIAYLLCMYFNTKLTSANVFMYLLNTSYKTNANITYFTLNTYYLLYPENAIWKYLPPPPPHPPRFVSDI